jgi:hypothetical protein
MQPRAVLLILLLLILVAFSGLWLWGRMIEGGAPSRVATVTMPPPTPTLAETATPTAAAPPPGYRLAGVAMGEPESFAVIEAPNGSANLYRLHDDVPGLGELVRIEAERVAVRGAAAEFDLWLTPAATATAAPAGTPKPRSPTRRPPLRTRRGGTTAAPESSGAPDPPAS